MNYKKFLAAFGAFFILSFLIAFVWHLILFHEVYLDLNVYTNFENPIIGLGILAVVLEGLVMAYLYPRYYNGGSPIVEGLKFSYLMGIFLLSVSVVAHAAKNTIDSYLIWFILEPVFHFVQFTIVGIAIGLIYGKNPTK